MKKYLSEEHKRNLSLAKLGTKLSEEHKRNISRSAENNPNYGMRGKHQTLESKRKTSKGNKGKHRTLEMKERLSKAKSGKNHPLYGTHHICILETRKKISASNRGIPLSEWKGFASLKLYTIDFSKLFRKRIRKRENYCCVVCNKSQKELKRQLSIHHIDYNKLNSFPQNCVSLCIYCHSKTNANKTFWTTFFQSLLKEMYGYQYTQDQKTILDF